MKRILIIMSVLFVTTFSTSFAQNQKEVARFYVLEATMNGFDVTSQVVNNKAYTVFYETDEGLLYMANVWERTDSQSWGPIFNVEYEHYPETSSVYESDEFVFDWAFSNSYDTKRGICEVSLSKIYKPEGVISILTLREDSGDVTVYTGYMEGSINFSKYY